MVCWPTAGTADALRVAVAANFRSTLIALRQTYQQTTDATLKISSGSSGKLTTQIYNGAPFDLFLSADQAHVDLLIANGHGRKQDRFSYARGRLLLAGSDSRTQAQSCMDLLRASQRSRVAIANPKTAPYGQAARAVLEQMGLWTDKKVRRITAENVSQAAQFVYTGNADFGFIAASHVASAGPPAGCLTSVDPTTYPPLTQVALILAKKAARRASAVKFVDFLKSKEAADIISRFGYGLPQTAVGGDR